MWFTIRTKEDDMTAPNLALTLDVAEPEITDADLLICSGAAGSVGCPTSPYVCSVIAGCK